MAGGIEAGRQALLGPLVELAAVEHQEPRAADGVPRVRPVLAASCRAACDSSSRRPSRPRRSRDRTADAAVPGDRSGRRRRGTAGSCRGAPRRSSAARPACRRSSAKNPALIAASAPRRARDRLDGLASGRDVRGDAGLEPDLLRVELQGLHRDRAGRISSAGSSRRCSRTPSAIRSGARPAALRRAAAPAPRAARPKRAVRGEAREPDPRTRACES